MICNTTVSEDTVILEVESINLFEIEIHLFSIGRGDYTYVGSDGNNLIYKDLTKW